jgi:ATP/maltotriose-dependent transcriptional regulator MalT
VACWDVRIQDGLGASAKALDIAEGLQDEVLWAHAAMSRGAHLYSSGRISEGFDLMHRAWQTADRLNDPVVFFAAFLGSAFANWIGDPTELKLWCERELARPRLSQAPGQRKRFLSRLAAAHASTGDLPLARSLMSAAGPSYDAWEVLFRSGDWEQCELLATRRVEASHRGCERAFAFEGTYDLARLRRAQGQSETAKMLLEQALVVAVDGGERAYELGVRSLLAQLCAETGQLLQARRHLAQAGTIVSNGEDWRCLAGQMSLAEGVVAIADGDWERPSGTFSAPSRPTAAMPSRGGEAETQLLWGRGLRNAGQAASATTKLRSAEELYRRHGAGEACLQRLEKERLSKRHSPYPNGLSEREVEVLRLIVAGKTNQQIGDELLISLNTVARHVSNIFAKAGVANRAEAASYAHQQGLVGGSLTSSC